MTVKLASVRIFNFRSVEDQVIEFPEKGLVLLEGLSGHGKSTVPLAISYALGFCPYPMTDLLRWGTENGGVELTFRDSSDVLLRSKKETRYGSKIGSKEVETRLNAELMGVNSEILKALTYNQQDDDSDFLSLRSSSRYDALFSIFPELSKLEAIGQAAKEKRGFLASELQRTEDSLGSKQDQVKTLSSYIATVTETAEALKATILAKLSEKEKHITERATLTERAEIFQKEVAVKNELIDLIVPPQVLVDAKVGIAEFEKTRPPAVNSVDVKERVAQAEKELQLVSQLRAYRLAEITKTIFSAVEELTRSKSNLRSTHSLALKRRPELILEISRLESGKCYTCSQPWHSEVQLDAMREEKRVMDSVVETYEQQHSEIEAQIAALKEGAKQAADKETAELDPKIKAASDRLEAVRSELAELEGTARRPEVVAWEEKHKLLSSELRALEVAFNAYKNQCLANLNQVKTEAKNNEDLLVKNTSALTALNVQITEDMKRLQNTLNSQASLIKEETLAGLSICDLKTQRVKLVEEVELEDSVSKILSKNGFLGEYLVEILEEITSETNKVLARIKNTERVTVDFSIEQTASRQNIVVSGYIQGNRVDLRSGCSGGMYSSVRLAARLGIRNVLSRRTGLNLGWLVLDESFNGLGSTDRESCLEILKEVASKDLVIVIDHDTKFKSMFDLRIEAKLDNSITTFNQRLANE